MGNQNKNTTGKKKIEKLDSVEVLTFEKQQRILGGGSANCGGGNGDVPTAPNK